MAGNYNRFNQKSMKKPSLPEIMKVFSQVKNITKTNGISENYDGVKKAMELAGMSMSQLKEFRSMSDILISNPIATTIAKTQGVNINEFLNFVDDFIANNEKSVPSETISSGNREMRRFEKKLDNRNKNQSNWRNR